MDEFTHLYIAAYEAQMQKNAALGGLARGLGSAFGKALGTSRDAMRFAAKVPQGQKFFAKPRHYVTRPARALLLPNLGTPLNIARAGVVGKSVADLHGSTKDSFGEIERRGTVAAQGLRRAGLGAPAQAVEEMSSRQGATGIVMRNSPLTSWLFEQKARGDMSVGEKFRHSSERAAYDFGSAVLRDKIHQRGLDEFKPTDWLTGPVTPFLKREAFRRVGQRADVNTLARRLEAGLAAGVREATQEE